MLRVCHRGTRQRERQRFSEEATEPKRLICKHQGESFSSFCKERNR